MYQTSEITLRTLTTDDYISAAKITASCPKDRLAVVLHLLKKAGFDLGYLQNLSKSDCTGLNAASVVNEVREFKARHDLTWNEMEEALKIPRDVIRSYTSGRRIPTQNRCDEMLSKLFLAEREYEKKEAAEQSGSEREEI